MEGLVQSLNSILAGASLTALPVLFGAGFLLAFNPCMAAMAPLAIGGNRRGGLGRAFLFMGGFTVTLMLLGLLAASIGKVLTLPGWFWTSLLGILYLIVGLMLMQFRLPITFSGFYVFENRPQWLRLIVNKEGLNPGALGSIFALAPSPCTMPAIMAVTAYVLASGHMLFGALALGFFGLGHSLPLALAFLPWMHKLFRPNRLTRAVRPALGMLLIVLAAYFLIARPDIISNSSMASHSH